MSHSRGTVLLTGFPRQAARVAMDMFVAQKRRVFLLSPKEFEEEAQAILSEGQGTVFTGNSSAIDLGLSGEEVKAIQTEVEEVHHLEDSYHGSPSTMRKVLVDGTRSLLEFALDLPKLRRFVLYSSLFSSGWKRGEVFCNEAQTKPARWHNTYEKIRWDSERWAQTAMRQLPVTVIRSGLLIGCTECPLDNSERTYHLLRRFVRRSLQIPLPLPEGGIHPLHICPTDYMLEMASRLLRNDASIGSTFHISDPHPPTAQEVLLGLGGKLPVDESLWADRLSSLISKLPGATPPPGAIHAYVSGEVWYDMSHTRGMIDGSIPHCPTFDRYRDGLLTSLDIKRKRSRKSR